MEENKFLECPYILLKNKNTAWCTIINSYCGMVRWCTANDCLIQSENYNKYGCIYNKK